VEWIRFFCSNEREYEEIKIFYENLLEYSEQFLNDEKEEISYEIE
jgi:hypothetical protein